MKKILAALTLGLALTLMPAMAQPGGPGGPGGHGPGRGLERMKQTLQLTDQQVSQLQPLFAQQMEQHKARFQQMRTQMDSVLTAEQKTKLEAMKAEWKENRGKGPRERGQRGDFAARLGLTQDQQDKLKAMREQGKQEMQAEREAFKSKLAQVLTPEQLTKLEEMKKNHHRGGGRGKPAQG